MSTTFRLIACITSVSCDMGHGIEQWCSIELNDGSVTRFEFDGPLVTTWPIWLEFCSRPLAGWLSENARGTWEFSEFGLDALNDDGKFSLTLHDDTDAVAFALAWSDRIIG